MSDNIKPNLAKLLLVDTLGEKFVLAGFDGLTELTVDGYFLTEKVIDCAHMPPNLKILRFTDIDESVEIKNLDKVSAKLTDLSFFACDRKELHLPGHFKNLDNLNIAESQIKKLTFDDKFKCNRVTALLDGHHEPIESWGDTSKTKSFNICVNGDAAIPKELDNCRSLEFAAANKGVVTTTILSKEAETVDISVDGSICCFLKRAEELHYLDLQADEMVMAVDLPKSLSHLRASGKQISMTSDEYSNLHNLETLQLRSNLADLQISIPSNKLSNVEVFAPNVDLTLGNIEKLIRLVVKGSGIMSVKGRGEPSQLQNLSMSGTLEAIPPLEMANRLRTLTLNDSKWPEIKLPSSPYLASVILLGCNQSETELVIPKGCTNLTNLTIKGYNSELTIPTGLGKLMALEFRSHVPTTLKVPAISPALETIATSGNVNVIRN